MTTSSKYKDALGRLDKDVRTCIKYLENLINDKFNAAIRTQQPPPRVNLSKIESSLDSLRKQIDGLRPKIDAAHNLVQEHDEHEKYLNTLTEKAEEMFDVLKEHFEELYKSGYYSEGTRRKIREEGIFRKEKLNE